MNIFKNIFTLSNLEKTFLKKKWKTSAIFIITDPRVHWSPKKNRLFIDNYDAITEQEYAEISRYMVRQGYDWRGPDDARELLTRDVYINNGYDGDIAQAISQALNLQIQFVEEENTLDAEDLFEKAKQEFPPTDNPNVAGYLLPDGTLLDFSSGHARSRDYDHRDITHIDDSLSDLTNGMVQFMNLGAIRLGPTGDEIWINIIDNNPPTSEQYSVLRDLIKYFNGNVRIEISGPKGNPITSKDYGSLKDLIDPYEGTRSVNSERIINEIKRAIRTGKFPEESVMDFR